MTFWWTVLAVFIGGWLVILSGLCLCVGWMYRKETP